MPSAAELAWLIPVLPLVGACLSGLGLIRMRQDRVDEAIAAFEKALALHPHLDGAKANLDTLRRRRRDGAI